MLIELEELKHKINNSKYYGTDAWRDILDMAVDCSSKSIPKGKAEQHKMLEGGTLVVSVADATAVIRVLVEDNKNVNICNKADRPRGEWIERQAHDGSIYSQCSECNYFDYDRDDLTSYNFCPDCGADMRGE